MARVLTPLAWRLPAPSRLAGCRASSRPLGRGCRSPGVSPPGRRRPSASTPISGVRRWKFLSFAPLARATAMAASSSPDIRTRPIGRAGERSRRPSSFPTFAPTRSGVTAARETLQNGQWVAARSPRRPSSASGDHPHPRPRPEACHPRVSPTGSTMTSRFNPMKADAHWRRVWEEAGTFARATTAASPRPISSRDVPLGAHPHGPCPQRAA